MPEMTMDERAANYQQYAHELTGLTDKELSREVYRLTDIANREDYEPSVEQLDRLDAAEFEEERRASLQPEVTATGGKLLREMSPDEIAQLRPDQFKALAVDHNDRLEELSHEFEQEAQAKAPVLAQDDKRFASAQNWAEIGRQQDREDFEEALLSAEDLRRATRLIPFVAGITNDHVATLVEQGEIRGFINHNPMGQRPAETLLTTPIQIDRSSQLPEPNAEVDRILEGLLKPRLETYAEELRRRAREQGHDLRDQVATPDLENDLDLER